MPALIECVDLIKIYEIPEERFLVPALRGVSLKIYEGEFIALIGPSGSGKSTFIRLIGGFDQPSSGKTLFKSIPLNSYTERELEKYRQNIGFLYQLPEDNLLPGLTILQNVMLPMRLTSRFRGEQDRRAMKLLSDVGLRGKERRKMNQLSGGELQRAGLAVALANGPELLLADEPTGELDTTNTSEIIDLLKELNRELGITVITVTHDMRFARVVDTVYRLKDGRIVSYSTGITESTGKDAVYVDTDGTIRLPEEVMKSLSIADGDGIKFEITNERITITVERRTKKNDKE